MANVSLKLDYTAVTALHVLSEMINLQVVKLQLIVSN